MFLLGYRNTSESLGEWEILWEHEPQGSVSTAFWVLPNLYQSSYTCNLIEAQSTFRKYRDTEKKIDLFSWIIQMWILLAHAIITSTPRASSVILLSYRNIVLNQSAHVFALVYFLKPH